MSTSFLKSVLLALVLAVPGMAGEPIPLPTDPATPVIEMWYVDHGVLREPEVAVFASGRIRVNIGQGSLWGEIDQNQIQALLSELLERDGFKVLRTESIQQELEAESARTGLTCNIAEAGDTIIRIRTADATYRIDGHAVGLLAARFPNCASLQKLYSAQSRLENVRAVVMIGGTEAAERLAKKAQTQLQLNHGELIELTPRNLSQVSSLSDGTRFCQFLVPTSSTTAPRIVTVFDTPGDTPRVSVLPDGPTIR